MDTIIIVLLCSIAFLAILYFILIMPKVGKRAKAREFARVLYAHRGLHDNTSDAPENSMKAFSLAVEKGFGIELDVQLTKDNVVVVFHDFTLERVCGRPGKVCEYTYEELKSCRLCGSSEGIPTLEQVLALVDGRVPLVVELKIEYMNTALCPIADGILSQYKGQYCIESFNPLGVLWYRKNRPEIIRGQLSDAFFGRGELTGALYFALENLLLNCVTQPDFVAYNHKSAGKLSRRICRSLYRNLAVAWTIRSEDELTEARKHFDMFIFDSFVPGTKQ